MSKILLALAFALASCGQQAKATSNLSIINGDLLPSHYKNVMKIVHTSGTCVGTATDDHHLVTSASCMHGDASEWTIDNEGTKVSVKAIKYNAGYDASKDSVDIATVTTSSIVKADWYASISSETIKTYTETLAVGFGEIMNNAKGVRNTGRLIFAGYTPIYDAVTQSYIYNGMMVFIGPKFQLATHGDEGSPLFYNGKLIGVLSKVYNPTPTEFPSVRYVSLKNLQ